MIIINLLFLAFGSQLLLFCLVYQQQLMISQLTKSIYLQNELAKTLQITLERVNSLVDKNHTEFLNAHSSVVDTVGQTSNNILMIVICFLLVGSLSLISIKKTDLSSLENLLDKPVDINPQLVNLFSNASETILSAVEKNNVDAHVKIGEGLEKFTLVLYYLINSPK